MSKSQTPRDPDLLARLWSDIGLALRLLIDRRVSGGAKLIPALMVLYILSPLDFLPDLLLPFGVVDDLGAFLLGLQLFIHSAPREVVNEYRRVRAPAAPGTPRDSDTPPHVIDGHFYEVLDAEWDAQQDEHGGPNHDRDHPAQGRLIPPPRRR